MVFRKLSEEAVVGLLSISFKPGNDNHRHINRQVPHQLGPLRNLAFNPLNLQSPLFFGFTPQRHLQPQLLDRRLILLDGYELFSCLKQLVFQLLQLLADLG